MALFSECSLRCARKVLDTADKCLTPPTLSEIPILRQQLAHHFHGLSTRALKGHILVKGSMAQPGG